MWATFGELDVVRDAVATLRRWCDEVGRDPADIRWVFSAEASVLRDTESEATRVAREIGRHNGGWEGPGQAWTPERLAEKLAPYVELGFREIYLDMPAPYDDETLVRFVREVGPMLGGGASDDSAADGPAKSDYVWLRRNRSRRSSWALSATTIVEALIATAPSAIGRSMPHGTSSPAATGIATTL